MSQLEICCRKFIYLFISALLWVVPSAFSQGPPVFGGGEYDGAGRPENDLFENRIFLSSDSLLINGSLIQATQEFQEPPGYLGSYYLGSYQTVWWEWAAPSSGNAFVSTDTNPVDFIVYKGSTVEQLTRISDHYQNQVFFEAVEGESYLIQAVSSEDVEFVFSLDLSTVVLELLEVPSRLVAPLTIGLKVTTTPVDGEIESVAINEFDEPVAVSSDYSLGIRLENLSRGEYLFQAVATNHLGQVKRSNWLSLAVRPENDDFADRFLIDHLPYTNNSRIDTATREPDEPEHLNTSSTRSAWWSWTARETGYVKVINRSTSQVLSGVSEYPLSNVFSNQSDSYLSAAFLPPFSRSAMSIYTGNSLADLELIRSSRSDEFLFFTEEGIEYQIVNTSLHAFFELESIPPPLNDSFVNRILLEGDEVSVSSTTHGATLEEGEPEHLTFNEAHSVWWEWQSPFTETMIVLSDGMESTLDEITAVYQGDGLENLELIASGRGEVEFDAVNGARYLIATASTFEDGQRFILKISRLPPPVRIAEVLWSDEESGYFSLEIVGEDGQAFKIQATSDFGEWSDLLRGTLFGETLLFRDGGARFFNHRFYRVILLSQ